MASSKNPAQGRILLDWFTVSYRTIVISLVFLFGVAGAVFLFFTLKAASGDTPEGMALQELTRAERLFGEAESAAHEEGSSQTIQRAGRLLESGRRFFRERNFTASRDLSLQSQSLSKRILEANSSENSFTAKIYRFEGEVKLKRVRQFVWESVTSNVALKVGDQIKTASSGSAQIVYFDGTITTIKPGSLLEIRELFEDPATKIRKVREKLNFGGVLSTTQGGNAAGSFHEVATETSTARAEDRSQFAVEYDQAIGKTRMAVESGEAEVRAGSRTVKLASLESVTVNAEQQLAEKEKILAPPSLLEPIDQRIFVYDPTAPAATTLRWGKVPGAVTYRLQISQQPLFGLLLLDKNDVESTSVVLPDLSAGSYYWRVSSRDASGIEGAFSETRKFRIGSERERGPEDRVPPALQIVDFLPSGALVIINGRTEPSAIITIDGQAVDVYDDGSFTAVVKMKHDGMNSIEILAQDVAGNETRMRKSVYVETY